MDAFYVYPPGPLKYPCLLHTEYVDTDDVCIYFVGGEFEAIVARQIDFAGGKRIPFPEYVRNKK